MTSRVFIVISEAYQAYHESFQDQKAFVLQKASSATPSIMQGAFGLKCLTDKFRLASTHSITAQNITNLC